MPDFFRSMVVVDKEFYRSKRNKVDTEKSESLKYIFCNPAVKMYEDGIYMEIEDQKYIEDYTSPHQLILNSINYIYILESFCSLNNIELYWTTWDLPTATILQELARSEKFKLKKFIPLFPPNEVMGFNSYVNINCDSDHGSEFRTHRSWPLGSDYIITNNKKQKSWSHPGIHFQYHLADFFHDIII